MHRQKPAIDEALARMKAGKRVKYIGQKPNIEVRL